MKLVKKTKRHWRGESSWDRYLRAAQKLKETKTTINRREIVSENLKSDEIQALLMISDQLRNKMPTLRDQFAMRFAAAMIISEKKLYDGCFYEKADAAYEFADSMLEARKQPDTEE